MTDAEISKASDVDLRWLVYNEPDAELRDRIHRELKRREKSNASIELSSNR